LHLPFPNQPNVYRPTKYARKKSFITVFFSLLYSMEITNPRSSSGKVRHEVV
jgi:hypothetical protein